MIECVTKTGFTCELDEKKMDNMELLDTLAEISENPLNVSKVVKLILSDDQRKALYDHLRTEDGCVPISAVSEAIVDIFNSTGQQGKNS